jgi:trehalose-phosphatase
MTADITPDALADIVRPVLATALVGFDVDGVLAPIVEHAADARLSPGVAERLDALAVGTQVVIVSGRSLSDLEQLFGFGPALDLIGSHGLERRGHDPLDLTDAERFTFGQLETLGDRAVDAAGDGAWLEYKPASVVVHVRSADPARARPAIGAVARFAAAIDGAHVQHGHEVVELLARSTSKGSAIAGMRRRGQPVVFVGDDVTARLATAWRAPTRSPSSWRTSPPDDPQAPFSARDGPCRAGACCSVARCGSSHR